jgi:HPt (histidine-containing phosphotransfer) domain-containing protein
MENSDKIVVTVESELKELVPGFLQNRRESIEDMLVALEREDYEALRILGHNMKGTGSGYGFDTITDIGRSLESAAKTGDAGEIKKLAEELSDYLSRVEVVYE